MIPVITAEDLKHKLKREKHVEVQGLGFMVRKVSLLLLVDDPRQVWDWARAGSEVLVDQVKPLLQNPSLPAMRRVLMTGIVEPRMSEYEEPNAVPIEMILSNSSLAAELFIEIVNLSLQG